MPSHNFFQGPSASAYVTYVKPEDALRAIQAVNNCHVDGRTLKASLGTTKYCSHFLRGSQCPKPVRTVLSILGEYFSRLPNGETESMPFWICENVRSWCNGVCFWRCRIVCIFMNLVKKQPVLQKKKCNKGKSRDLDLRFTQVACFHKWLTLFRSKRKAAEWDYYSIKFLSYAHISSARQLILWYILFTRGVT